MLARFNGNVVPLTGSATLTFAPVICGLSSGVSRAKIKAASSSPVNPDTPPAHPETSENSSRSAGAARSLPFVYKCV